MKWKTYLDFMHDTWWSTLVKRDKKIFHLRQPIFFFILDKEEKQEDSMNHCESNAFQNKVMCISPLHFHYTEQKRKKIVFNTAWYLSLNSEVMYIIIEIEHTHTSAMTYIHFREEVQYFVPDLTNMHVSLFMALLQKVMEKPEI